MADVALRFTTTGAAEAIQSFNQVAQSSQRFASTSSQTLTQARVATQAFNFVLFDMARIARMTGGAAGKEFADSLETAFVAVSTARGAVAAYRGVLQSQELITKAVTAATIALNTATAAILSPMGLTLLAVGGVIAAYLAYEEHLRRTQQALKDTTTAQEQNALAIVNTGQALDLTVSAQERLALVMRGVNRFWAEQAARSADLRDRLAEEAANRAAAAAAREHEIQQWLINSVPVLRGQQAMADRWVAIGKAAEDAARKQKQVGVDSEKALFDIGIQALNTYTETQNAASDAADVQALSAADAALMAKNAWVESQNAQADAALDAQQRIQAGVENMLAGVLKVTTQGTDLFSQLWVAAANAAIEQLALVQAAASFITGILGGIFPFLFLQRGGSFIATRPTPMMVGEAGAERVTVSPLAGASAAGGAGLTVNFNAPQFWDEYTFDNFARRVGRLLTTGPVGRVG